MTNLLKGLTLPERKVENEFQTINNEEEEFDFYTFFNYYCLNALTEKRLEILLYESLLENNRAFAILGLHYTQYNLMLAKMYFEYAYYYIPKEPSYIDYTILGLCYRYGTQSLEQSFEKAVTYYREAMDKGCIFAPWLLGNRYSFGQGIEQDKMKALEYFRLSADKGCIGAMQQIVDHYSEKTIAVPEKKKFLKLLTNKGDMDACFSLAYDYFLRDKELKTDKYRQKRIKYYTIVADQKNHIIAQHNLGVIHKHDGNIDTAKKWFKKAALQQYPDSQYELGKLYYDNKTEKDITKGIQLIECAANNKFENAKQWLGEYYSYRKEWGEAIKWYKLCPHNAQAYYDLANIYEIQKDYESAYTYHVKAAEMGFENSYYSLAGYYIEGIYVKKDIKCALEWMYKAKTHPDALYFLARNYLFSIDSYVGVDISKGIEYLEKTMAISSLAITDHLKVTDWKFLQKHLNNALIVSRWPSTFDHIKPQLQITIIEIALCFINNDIPFDLFLPIIQNLIFMSKPKNNLLYNK